MNKAKLFSGIVVVIAVGAGIFFLSGNKGSAPIEPAAPVVSEGQSVFDAKNATYIVEGKSVTLVNGVAEVEAAPGSTSKIITRYFGNEATGDLNSDGLPDMAFLITQEGGGSGLFYYAVVALKREQGYTVTNVFFVGDRIAPQTTEINESAQELYVNYAERKPDEPMTAQPSVGVTLLLKVTSEGVLNGLMQ